MIKLVENFISEKAKIGENVKIWHFAYVGDDTEIGDNTKIGSLAHVDYNCLLYTSPSPRDATLSRMPSSA